jgi:hypothetical protein
MSNYSTRPDVGTGGWLMGALTRNPEGLLLLAAGCALLMRKASATRPIERAHPHDEFRGTSRDSEHNGHTVRNGSRERNIGESVAHAARTAGEYASDMTERVTQNASSYASSVSDYAEEATERSRHIARQAQSTLRSSAQHILQEQPLAVAVAGLAVGAAVAATFPTTEVEKRALGPTGDRFLDAAGRAGEHLKEAGAEAGERLMSAAEERGLTRDGLKEVAQEVGGAFSSALSGDQKSPNERGQNSEGSRVRSPSGRPKQPGDANRSAQQTVHPQSSQGLRTGGSPQGGQSRKEGAPSVGSSSSGQPNSAGKRGPQ